MAVPPAPRLPTPGLLTPRRLALLGEAFRFAVVGTAGFVWDAGTVYALRGPLGLYVAGLVAWLVAVTVNWAFNRAWTFRGRAWAHPWRQWGRFVAANSLGLVLNRGTFAALVLLSPLCRSMPVLAVAAGSGAGLLANFALSRRMVFR